MTEIIDPTYPFVFLDGIGVEGEETCSWISCFLPEVQQAQISSIMLYLPSRFLTGRYCPVCLRMETEIPPPDWNYRDVVAGQVPNQYVPSI